MTSPSWKNYTISLSSHKDGIKNGFTHGIPDFSQDEQNQNGCRKQENKESITFPFEFN